MKTHLLLITLFLNISLFAQQYKTSSTDVFVKIKDDFAFDLSAYSNAKSVKTQSKNAIIESLFFNLFDKYEVKSSNKASKLKSSKLQRIYKISIKDSTKLNAFLADIKENKFVEYAEKIPIYELFYTPNDLHPNQWYLPKINAAQAWDLSVGVGSVVIAIVDDAVRLDHQDLAPNIWVNPNEIAGNGIDDDANGYIDDINGYDVADGDNNPTTTNAGKKHGTHCAGIAAAKSNNGTGIASISSNCKIMAVKCTRDAVISPSIPFAYEGLEYAIAAKPDVISLSWGGFGSSQTYQLLFDYAYSLGITVVAAAGNNYTDVPFYPASYNHVISVGATDSNDQITSFSNYGSTIDVMAPGFGIWSSVSSSNAAYENLSGTSMACPLVAGLCGLMKSYVPSATNAFIEGCLTSSAINIDALNFGYENQMGFGRIDAFRALSCMNGKPVIDFDSDKTTPCVSQQVTFFDKSIGNGITNYGWTFVGANIVTSTLKDPVVSYSSPGTYSVTHSATNSKGTSSITKTSYITIKSPSAVISGTATITQGQQTFLKINFIGTAPFNFNINNGLSNTNYSNIYANPNYVFVAPNTTSTYTLNTFADASCAGNTSGSALITVNTVSGGPNTVIGSNCVSNNGLVAYFPFDGNANDASGNGNNGVLNGCTFVSDRNGNSNAAIKFNGTSDFIRVPNSTSLNPTTEMTFSVWIKPEGYFNSTFYSRYNQIFTSGYGNDATYQVRYNSNTNHGGTIPKFEFNQKFDDASASGIVSLQTANLNNMYHLVCVFTGNQQLIYINGILDNSIAIGSNKTSAISQYTNFYIGRNNDINYPYFVNGIMDELRIYNRALTDCEIKKLYDCNSTCSSGLVASYPFCGNANDVSGNNNNGTVSGATLTTDRFGNANSAYSFDGNDYIRILRNIENNFSVSLWVKSSMTGSNCGSNSTEWHCGYGIFDADKSGCSSDFGISINNGKYAYGIGSVTCNDNYLQTNNLFNNNIWHHIVAVRSISGFVKLYVDNVLLTSSNSSNNEVLSSQSRITFGGIENGSINSESIFRNLIGSIDDIKIYNKALSQSEITALYNEPAYCPNPISCATLTDLSVYYPFDGNANDESGNNKNATVLGATLTTDRLGNPNSAYNFNGSSYINMPLDATSVSGAIGYTFSAWIKSNNLFNDRATIFTTWSPSPGPTDRGFFVTVFESDINVSVTSGQSTRFKTGLIDNNWNHIAVVFDGSKPNGERIWMYLNGVKYFPDCTTVGYNCVQPSALGSNVLTETKIGTRINNSLINYEYFNGNIDEMRFYRRVLDDCEIKKLYDCNSTCSSGLVASYPFCGNANDVSGNNNNLSSTNTIFTQDKFANNNAAISLTGNGFLNSNSSNFDFGANSLSISTWIKSGVQTGEKRIVSKGHSGWNTGYLLGLNWQNQGSICFGVGGGSSLFSTLFYTSNRFDDNQWHHICAVHEVATKKSYIYIDGIKQSILKYPGSGGTILSNDLDFSSIFSSLLASSSNDFLIGKSPNNIEYFNGNIDNIKIYNKALTQSEITALYNEPAPCTTTGLVAHYPFCGNADDKSGNNYNGTVSGATLTTDRFGNPNSAYSFQSSLYQSILIPNMVNNNFSISFWMQSSQLGISNTKWFNGRGIISAEYAGCVRDFGSALVQNGKIQFGVGENNDCNPVGSTSSSSINNGLWNHIVLTRNSSNGSLSVYINGIIESTINSYTTSLDYPTRIAFGSDVSHAILGSSTSQDFFYSGKIDDIKIYDKALSQSEITALYNEPAPCTTTGLVAHYPFCGNADDKSGNNYNGTVSGATLTTDRFGNANSAYSFDGINDLIEIDGQNISLNKNISISLWIKTLSSDTQASFAGLIDRSHNDGSGGGQNWVIQKSNTVSNGYYFTYNKAIGLNFSSNYGETATISTNQDNWEHLVYTKSNNIIKCYKNRQLISTDTYSLDGSIVPNVNENILIGSVKYFSNRFFKGSIDDIKIYSKALSQAEITALYNEPAPCTTTGLVAHYPFCGNADDKSGNNYNGTVSGATLTTDRFGNANSAYSFDGTNACYINTNFKGVLGTNPRSVSAWVKLASTKEMYAFGWGSRGVAYGNCYAGGFSYSSPLSIITEGNDVVKGYGNTNLNTWHHIVWVAESNITFNQTKIYYDGVLLTSASENYVTSRVLNTIENITLKIGANPLVGSNLNFQGSIDDIKIYDKALSQSEITALYNEPAYCPTQICNPVSITGNTSFCKGITSSSQTYTVNDLQGATYFWSVSGLGIIGTGASITINWQDVGNFTLQVISSNLCQGSATKLISINCCSNPSTAKAEFFLTSDAVCGKAYIPIFNNSIGNSFSWDFGKDASITNFNGKNPPTIFYNKAGNKNIKLVVKNLCGVKDSLVKQVFVQPQPFAYAGKDIVSCSSDAQELGSSEIGFFQYQWSPITAVDNPNIAKPNLIKTFTGTVVLKVSQFDETFDCPAYDTLNVVRLDSSFSTILPREVTSICEDVVLNVVSSRNTNRYLWNTGSTISGIKVSESGVYFVKTYNSCVEKIDSVQVKIHRPAEKIPNVITPNGDTFNEVLEFYGCYFEQNPFSIQIYNRYGVKVYESDNYKNNWNADGLPDGIYYFSTQSIKSQEVKKGWIQILR